MALLDEVGAGLLGGAGGGGADSPCAGRWHPMTAAVPFLPANDQGRRPPLPAPAPPRRGRCRVCGFLLADPGEGGCQPTRCHQRQECIPAILGIAEEEPIPGGGRVRVVPRGHCSRCDRCGVSYAAPGEFGCHPGECAHAPVPPPRANCSRCGGRYPSVATGPRPLRSLVQLRLHLEWDLLVFGERSLHPDKITQKERASWVKLTPGVWDRDWVPERSACRTGPRPCPWTRCRHHAYLEVHEEYGTIRLNFFPLPPDQMYRMRATCTLDEADKAEAHREATGKLMTLQRVADNLGMTLERARQIQGEALRKIGPEGARVLAARLQLPVLPDG